MTEGTHLETICVLPWIHLATTVDGVWGRCCFDATNDYGHYYYAESEPIFKLSEDALGCSPRSRYAVDNPEKAFNPSDAFNSPQMRKTRLQMIRGEQPEACKQCYSRESAGLQSHRMAVNDEFIPWRDFEARVAETTADGTLALQPIYLDLRFGNTCNLSCIMCGFPITSSRREDVPAWARAAIDPFHDDGEFWEQLERWAPGLLFVYFAGGEPFLQRGHDRALDLFLRTGAAEHIELRYNSNLTVLPKGGFARLRSFKKVEISASCDGVGELFETIRVGGRWDNFVRNVREARKAVDVLLDVTVQRENVSGLSALLDFARTEGLRIRLENFVDDPPHLSARALPEADIRAHSEKITRLIRDCENRGETEIANQLARIIVYMNT